ncbi:uncharacterized protein LY79DRAFT_706478 [Colletotrichum navitas]|uniref:Uncharacterized protein n=1 Tax=Colletotrichum navitas TaxID=681940 RepID=A0AAD8UYZ5_9PEZI|nr:uncharacterized protein LY79DRAFT_706478 [Colletotrichum navitas]KAK1574361.1 hypothetical protein LY79DRAFT_706478 [Colletotrichum navitas]
MISSPRIYTGLRKADEVHGLRSALELSIIDLCFFSIAVLLTRRHPTMFRRKDKPAREPPEVFSYDRDVPVSLVKRHYQLLVDMGHLHPEAVQAPSEPRGWSDAELNVDALWTLGWAAICAPKDPEAKAIKNLYREYGWLGAFRKEEFLCAAVPARAAIIDDQYSWSDED